jgi:Protein of unknown function (DUF1570)
MELVVIARDGRGRGVHLGHLMVRGRRGEVASGVFLMLTAIIAGLAGWDAARAQPPSQPGETRPAAPNRIASRDQNGIRKPPDNPALPTPGRVSPARPVPHVAKRYKFRDDSGHCAVGRLHGQYGDKTTLILPDGQLGIPSMLVPTDQPFKPIGAEELGQRLLKGPFAGYQLLKTAHYLILYQSTPAFAEDSGRLLDDLYEGLIEAFDRNGIPVHESEFPLVAVIFDTEGDFRAHKEVDSDVQAYYEFCTNRIFFYEKPDQPHAEPKVAALLKPQTVAHEGAHQILSNIGVQPRPSNWPLWLVEGLAEYCATTAKTKKGVAWGGLGTINALHMATIRELNDPHSIQVNAPNTHSARFASQRRTTRARAESLMLETTLTPTDYARAWAMTHYLARQRGDDFVKYLKAMGQIPPLLPRTPEEHLAEFRKFFVEDLTKLDKKVDDHIKKLSNKKGYDPLPYYAVMFEWTLPNGMLQRDAMVSQSPQIIQQRVNDLTSPDGVGPYWEAIPGPTRAKADDLAWQWWRGY